jgi:hypothetical protein
VADVYLPAAPAPAAAAAVAVKPGMWRSLRDHSVMTVAEAGRLNPAGRKVEVDGDRLKLIGEADTIGYEWVEASHPTREELASLAGEYASDEAEVTLRVALDGDRLVVRRRPASEFPLTPTYKDGFASQLGSVRFLRDGSGKVTELSVGESRVWDLRFRKVK